MTTVRDLIDVLTERQQALGETDAQFGKRIGMSQQGWNFAKRRVFKPGRRTLRGISAAFPELMPEVMAFILSRETRIVESELESSKSEAS